MGKRKGQKKTASLPEFSADFETITDPNDCRVWAWGCCDIDAPEDTYIDGNDITMCLNYFKTIAPAIVNFFNEKFDGMFILDWLFKNGYRHVETEYNEPEDPGTFTTIISDLGMFYQIKIMYKETSEIITIRDAAKLIPGSVETMAEDFGLDVKKIHESKEFYERYREVGHELDEEEREYLKHDVIVVAKALKMLRDEGMTKMTTAGCAMSDFLGRFGGKKVFRELFPVPKNDHDIRQAYHGGWTYCNPRIAGKDIFGGIVLDVNSLYPSVMRYEVLPYGEPMFFYGKYKKDVDFPLYVQHIRCEFEIKPDHVPTIQIKNSPRFVATEYLESSNGEEVDLVLTNVDLELFLAQYDVYNLEYIDGWMYAGYRGFFDEYIDYWTEEKIKAKKVHNWSRYITSKLHLNSLYGKLAQAVEVKSKIPYWDEEKQRVCFKISEPTEREGLYIAMAAFITAYARKKTITTAQKVIDALGIDTYCYSDTDSCHFACKLEDLPDNIEIDSFKLGAWDHETSFKRARFLHAKCYIEDTYTEWSEKKQAYTYTDHETDTTALKVTIAGLPAKLHEQVTWENFHAGAEYTGKLIPKVVNGGVVLTETNFKIK